MESLQMGHFDEQSTQCAKRQDGQLDKLPSEEHVRHGRKTRSLLFSFREMVKNFNFKVKHTGLYFF